MIRSSLVVLSFLVTRVASAAEVPVQEGDTPTVAAPADDGTAQGGEGQREARMDALKASVKLELGAFQKMLGLGSALIEAEGAAYPAEAKAAHDAASAMAKEAQQMIDQGAWANAWRKLHEAWAANAPSLRYVFGKTDMASLEPMLATYLDALSSRVADLGDLVGSGPAEARTHYDAGKALFDQAKSSNAAGDPKGGFVKAREAMGEFDQAVRALFKAAKEDQRRRRGR
jgi:hypothetical protein